MELDDIADDASPVIASLPMGGGAVRGPGAGKLCVRWGLGNELRVVRARGPGVQGPGADGNDPGVSKGAAYVVQWGCVTGASAALARATLPAFERLRARLQIAQQGDASQESARAVAASRLFAAAVSVALDTHLNDANEKAAHSPDDESASASTHAGYLAAAKATWQLCGAVFVEPGDGSGFVSQSLVEWFKENAGACGLGQNGLPERLRATLFEIGEISDESNAFRNGHDGDDDEDGQADADARKRHPEDAAGYWECFASLVAVGWVDAAVDLVGLHSCWDQWRVGVHSAKPHAELLEAVVALLRCVPRMASVSDETIAEEEQFGDGLGDGDDADWRIFGGQNSKRGRDRESQKNAKEETTNSNGFTAVSAPQFAAFREAWIRQVQRVLDDVALFDQCPDSRVATGCRAALSAMAGEETAVSRAVPHNAGWMELFIAETRCRFTSLRVAGDCAALVRRCVASRGVSQNTPEMDELLIPVLEADAPSVTAAVSKHLDAWFLANVSEMLVAAAGGDAWANELFSGAVLRRPVATLRGASQAELHLVEYGHALATRSSTRDMATQVFPWCPTRGVSACGAVVGGSGVSPSCVVKTLVSGPDGFADAESDEFSVTQSVLKTCETAALPTSVKQHVAWRAASGAHRRGDATSAAAWGFGNGDDGFASNGNGFSIHALALAQLPSVFQAARDPVGAAAALLRLAGEHPQVTSGGAFHGNMDMWNNENVSTIPNSWNHPGAASFLDALAKFKRSLVDLSKVGTDLSSTAEATARVLSDATREKTKNTASAFCELLTQNETTQHLWRSVLFLAIPLLEGTRIALSKAQTHVALARLEQANAFDAEVSNSNRTWLELKAMCAATHTVGDARSQAARLALAREYARVCVAR